jgi:hypothetical protein
MAGKDLNKDNAFKLLSKAGFNTKPIGPPLDYSVTLFIFVMYGTE